MSLLFPIPRDQGDHIGSRADSESLQKVQPALRTAVEEFQKLFDRRPAAAELAAIGLGIEAAWDETPPR